MVVGKKEDHGLRGPRISRWALITAMSIAAVGPLFTLVYPLLGNSNEMAVGKKEDDSLVVQFKSRLVFPVTAVLASIVPVSIAAFVLMLSPIQKNLLPGWPLVLALIGAALTAAVVVAKGAQVVEKKADSPRLNRLSRGSFTASSSSDLEKDADPGPREKQLLKDAKKAAREDAVLSGIEFAGISVILAGAALFFIDWYVS